MTPFAPFRIMDGRSPARLKKPAARGRKGDEMKRYRLLAAALLGVLAVIALYGLLFSRVSAQDIRDALSGLGPWAPAAYVGLFTLLPALFFPVAVLALAGGLLFGLWAGSAYTFLGAMLNCALMFLLSRYVGRETVRRYVERKLSPRWRARLERAGGREGFVLLVILRLIPAVPYNLINYTFGLTPMSLGTYLTASAIGIIPGTVVFINIGDKALDIASPAFWTSLGLLALLLAVTGWLGRRLFPPAKDQTDNKKGDI